MTTTPSARDGSKPPTAFINLPYARTYEKVYLAFIAGVSGYGLVPTAAVRLHIPSLVE
jgi:hypothetical protein